MPIKSKGRVDLFISKDMLKAIEDRRKELGLTRSKLIMRLLDGFALRKEAIERGDEEEDIALPTMQKTEPESQRIRLSLSPKQRRQLEQMGGYSVGVREVIRLYLKGALDPYLAPQLRTGKYPEYKKALKEVRELIEDFQ